VRVGRILAATLATSVIATACSSDDEPLGDPPTAPTVVVTTTTAPPPTTTTTLAEPRLADVEVAATPIVSGLTRPLAFAVRTADDALYVAEQAGLLRAVRDGVLDPAPVLDLTGDITDEGNEQGLLGIAFSPIGDRLYVDFTDNAGDTRIQEFTVDASGQVDPASRRELLAVDQPARNHNGGHLVFGPEGLLYIGFGDGGGGGDPNGNGQDLSTLLGAILRIDPRPTAGAPYGVPDDNPFVGRADARAEIWMYGLRNPWRFSFDRATGDLWIGDVGQSAYEEIDFAAAGDQAGANWGWNAREGAHDYSDMPAPGARDPIFEYGRDEGVSVSGGFVYRGDAIPALRGAYVFADYAAGRLIALVERDGQIVGQLPLGVEVAEVTSFGEDLDGELYVVSRRGDVFRLVAA